MGDKKWEEWLTDLGKPFFRVRYFDRSEEAKAWEWLRQPEEATPANWLSRAGELASRHPIAAAAAAVAFGFLLWGAMGRRSWTR